MVAGTLLLRTRIVAPGRPSYPAKEPTGGERVVDTPMDTSYARPANGTGVELKFVVEFSPSIRVLTLFFPHLRRGIDFVFSATSLISVIFLDFLRVPLLLEPALSAANVW
jgi:hypothetical protein